MVTFGFDLDNVRSFECHSSLMVPNVHDTEFIEWNILHSNL